MPSILLRVRHHEEAVRAARVLAKIALASGDAPLHPNHPRAARGTPADLRGLPAIGRGIGRGAIRGTTPGDGLH